jgi:DNA ligase-associated metallophosphoesterase
MQITLNNNQFHLLPQRAIFWQRQSALILSDLHFGKATHFRKGGIPIPEALFTDDLKTLNKLVIIYKPQSLIIVGDMFHSHHNQEIEQFGQWRHAHPALNVNLVKGNHDILAEKKYRELNIEVKDVYEQCDFVFSHHELKCKEPQFCFNGHIHPGVKLEGFAKQSLKLPCFHFTKTCCTLPAFSKFTGLSIITPENDDRIYAIEGNEILQIHSANNKRNSR